MNTLPKLAIAALALVALATFAAGSSAPVVADNATVALNPQPLPPSPPPGEHEEHEFEWG